jgi:hypothetical protein
MRRFVTLAVLLLLSVPFGASISGCAKKFAPTFCNGGDSGLTTGQTTNITLAPAVYGVSLNFSEIGQVNTPSATDCKGASVSVSAYTYGTTNMAIADVQPNSGRLCGGTWNRNSGGGIPDYTYCTPPANNTVGGVAYISASAGGVTSNPLPVFVHPEVTSIVLGAPSTSCATDPATNCSPAAVNLSVAPTTAGSCPTSLPNFPTNSLLPNGCCTIPPSTVNPIPGTVPYTGNGCVSQGTTTQLSARVYAGTGTNQTNISCLAGHLNFSAQGSGSSNSISTVLSIDQNGVATAAQPGSVLISAIVSLASSSAGFFSTCSPASIALSAPGAQGTGTPANPVIVNQNNPQPLEATILDTNNKPLTGLSLTYESTSPIQIPPGSGSVTPALAGSASISALCVPPGCNSSPYSQLGLFGNGKPVTSNSLNFTAPGTNSTVLYMASTQSLYVESRDFTQAAMAAPFLLPYLPNSMVITNDGSTIYMGSSATPSQPGALMVLNAVNTLTLSRTDVTSPGTVLAVSPDGATIVLSDPIKQVITLESSSGGVVTTYGGVGTHAEFSPDSQTVYVAAGDQVLVYSTYTGWTSISPATTAGTPVTDVAVTVPAVGAYFAGPSPTTARGYCPSSTATTIAGVTTESNIFYPPADSAAVTTDRIAATNDGMHIIGATVTPAPALSDLAVEIPDGNCPQGAQTTNTSGVTTGTTGGLTFHSGTPFTFPLTPITASAITGVLPTSDSALAVVTYTGSGGVLPAYAPSSSGTGTLLTPIKLSGAATAPVAGVISGDNTTIYIGTATDNLVHLITGTPGAPATYTDTSTLTPGLAPAPGVTTVPPGATTVPVNLLVQKPRKTT